MANNFEEIIARQEICFRNIKELCVSYRKHGSLWNISDLTSRLAALDSYWAEFEINNKELLKQQTYKDRSHVYFAKKVYEKTKMLVNDSKDYIQQRKRALDPETQTTQKFDFDEIDNTIYLIPIGVPVLELGGEDIEGLLKQQKFNFYVYERSAAKVNVDLQEKWKLEDHLKNLKAKWDAIDKTHWKIDYMLQGCHPLYQKQYSTWETRYEQLKKAINHKINRNTSIPLVHTLPLFR